MTAWMLTLVIVVGLTAGVLNFAAAGGSLLPFLFMTVVLGIPPLVGNATVLAATPTSFLRSIWDLKDMPRVMRIPLICAIGGTAVGVWFVSQVVSETAFRRAVPVLLLMSVVFLLGFQRVRKWIKARTRRGRLPSRSAAVVLSVGIAMTSVYAGAFGGGVGVLILVVLTVATPWAWENVNTVKNVVCLTTSVIGFVAFAPTGLVLWPVCGVLAVSMMVGGFVGKWVTRVVREEVLRPVVAVVTTLSAVHLWVSS